MQKRHHTKAGFRNNYVASIDRSLVEVLRWQFERVTQRMPPPPTVATPQQTANLSFIGGNARAAAEMIPAVSWIGHASVLVQASGLNVLTDPVFSNRASPLTFAGPRRAQPPGLTLDNLPHIDVVVVSHNHYDHLDRASIVALARQPGGSPLFLVPLGLQQWLATHGVARAIELDWWDRYIYKSADGNLPDDRAVEFHLTPAQHWSARALGDRNKTLWGSWAVFGTDFHWFFTGDTGYSPDFSDIRQRFAPRQTAEQGGGFDLALVAVGACLPRWFMRLQHVDLEEAVQVHLDLGAKLSIGVHWGTFALGDEPLDQPIHGLGTACAAKGIGAEQFLLLAVGATRQFERRGRGDGELGYLLT